MAKMQAAAQGGPVVDEAAMEEMRRLIFEAPIAELAESQGISIDEAVQLRVEKNLEAAEVPIEVTVRPIEKQGKTMGFASVNIGGMVVDDFRVIDGKNGVFLGAPSKPDPTSRTGYRSTARVMDRHLQEQPLRGLLDTLSRGCLIGHPWPPCPLPGWAGRRFPFRPPLPLLPFAP